MKKIEILNIVGYYCKITFIKEKIKCSKIISIPPGEVL
jgi:hypothetical protein